MTNTYSRPAYNNQQYFQDNTAAILVPDPTDIGITTYDEGDVVYNIKGNLFLGGDGVLRFVPTEANWDPATGNTPIVPEVVTTQQIKDNVENYESELVEIKNATFQNPGVNFANFHPINDNSGGNFSFLCKFPEANYMVTPTVIPDTPQDIVGIVSELNSIARISARSLSDFTLDFKEFEQIDFKLYPNPTSVGYVNILSKDNSKLGVSVFDLLGKQVKMEIISNGRLNVSNLKEGIYVLKIKQQDAILTKKLVIQ
ncbi:T9SS type A sorting domain-containing protein [Thalassobellus suaedae]|uniref:T9SS type A sorting domain-containing protein n=1 Tax=Thalassobellus suaedae TaxID=3074124 RepID=A0ABY9XQI1_9FLAO|nr:T9SS type A sorting domain-containing protein [Flavobacteriaceae bacterium HL-DH14]